jgi:hypothetical protein
MYDKKFEIKAKIIKIWIISKYIADGIGSSFQRMVSAPIGLKDKWR